MSGAVELHPEGSEAAGEEERCSALEETQGGLEGGGGLAEVIRSGPRRAGRSSEFRKGISGRGHRVPGMERRGTSSRQRPGLDCETLFPTKGLWPEPVGSRKP